MATRKVKRYSGEDGESEVSIPEEGTGLKEESFADAFKRNRSRGEKTFEFKGKKYTTETAADKAKAKDEAERKAQAERVKDEPGLETVSPELDVLPVGKLVGAAGATAAALKGMKTLGSRYAAKQAAEKAVADRAAKSAAGKTAARQSRAEASGAMKGEAKAGELRYKRGGGVKSASARADGCAIRGKTRA